MKLLFDQNLSPRLVKDISDSFSGSDHVNSLNLGAVADSVVWDFARREGFTIVSKDSDFADMALLYGQPPKVITITLGNCSTAQIESLLRMRTTAIHEFEASQDALLYLP